MRPSRWGVLVSAMLVLSACGTAAEEAADLPTGQDIARAKNCVSCHTASGGRSVGPTWRFLFGADVELQDGSVVVADSAYLERSIRQPQFEIVAGFTTVAMPSIDVTDAEVASLVAYIETLGRSGSLG